MSMESAMKRVSAGKNIVGNVPTWVLTEFVKLGVLHFPQEKTEKTEKTEMENVDSGISLTGYVFHKNVMKSVRSSFSLYEYLISQVAVANNLNKSLLTTLESYKNISKEKENKEIKEMKDKLLSSLKEQHKAMTSLVILPPVSTRKALDAALEVKQSADSLSYEDEEDDEDDYQDSKQKRDSRGSVSKKSSTLSAISKIPTLSTNSLKPEKEGREGKEGKEGRDRKRLSSDSLHSLNPVVKTDKTTDATAAASLLKSKDSKDSRDVKRRKNSLPECAAKLCSSEVATADSSYCSDYCAGACVSSSLLLFFSSSFSLLFSLFSALFLNLFTFF